MFQRKAIPRRGVVLIIGVLLVGVVVAWLWRDSDPDPESRAAGLTASQAEELSQRLTDLEARIERLNSALIRNARSRPSARSTNPGVTDPVAADELEGNSEAFELEARLRRESQLREYVAEFQAQSVDLDWGPTVERDLNEVMLSEGVISNVEEAPESYTLSCRSSMCEMSFDFANMAAGDAWATTFSTAVGGSLSRVWYTTIPRADGSVRLRIYGMK